MCSKQATVRNECHADAENKDTNESRETLEGK